MNEMQAHGLLIPVGSKPFEVWIDKNNSLARAIYATKHMEEVGYLDQLTFGHPVKEGELYSLICGDFVAFGVDEEGEIASLPQETIDKLKETFADPSTGYKEYIHIKYGIEPDRYQLQNEHAAGDKHEKSTKSLAEVATEARTRVTTTTAATISVIRVQSTTSIRSATNQSCMNRFKETRR